MAEPAPPGKDLLAHMRATGLDEYGSVISGDQVRSVLGLALPARASKQVFDRLALQELAAVAYVRTALLEEGKYFGQTTGDYRIFLPSENRRQVKSYMDCADGKLKRGLKLLRNTPVQDAAPPADNLQARMLMKREDVKRHRPE